VSHRLAEGNLFAFGVQYAPTDNVSINSGSDSAGYLGQMWAWTVQYAGGSNINWSALGPRTRRPKDRDPLLARRYMD
jgi:hypothetical protein